MKLSKTISISSFISSTTFNSFSPLEDSTSASSSTSSSSGKSVRFATHLYTIKKFNTKSAPISISEKSGNESTNYGTSKFASNLYENATLSNLSHINSKDQPYILDFLDYSDLDYNDKDDEYDNESDIEDNELFVNNYNLLIEKDSIYPGEENKFDIADWKIISSNLNRFKSNPKIDATKLEHSIFEYLNGQNIKVHSLELSEPATYDDVRCNNFGRCQISGLLFVNNLNFEKKVEIKFTLNNWTDIHYISANYSKSVTPQVDEFKFIIDISALKLNLVSKKLIFANFFEKKTACSLNLQFCCRYDVNGFDNRSFYDNNDYRNYELTISLSVINLNREISILPKNDSTILPLTLRNKNSDSSTSKINEKAKKPLRTFNKDTDYFNDSPIKHKFHHSFKAKAACKTRDVFQNSRTETNDSEVRPFDYFVQPLDSQTDEELSDSSYDLSLHDFNYWEFGNHGLGKALADSDILQFKNYPKSEPFSKYPIIDNTISLNTGDSTVQLKIQDLKNNLSQGGESSKTRTASNRSPLYDDKCKASFFDLRKLE